MNAALPEAAVPAAVTESRAIRVRAPHLRFDWAPAGIEFEIRVPAEQIERLADDILWVAVTELGGVITLTGRAA